jgi:hypothetical protein
VREEVQEVVGVRAGGIEPDKEGDGSVAPGQQFEALAELGVALGGLGDGEFGGGRLEVLAQKSGVMAVAGSVDADADADGWVGGPLRSRGRLWDHKASGKVEKGENLAARVLRGGRPSRKLVIRGQGLKR